MHGNISPKQDLISRYADSIKYNNRLAHMENPPLRLHIDAIKCSVTHPSSKLPTAAEIPENSTAKSKSLAGLQN